MQQLETERLILRPFTEQDIEEIYSLVYADNEVRKSWSGYSGTLADFRQRFAVDPVWHAGDGFGFLAVVLKENSKILGLMGFQKYEVGKDTSFMIFQDPADEIGRDLTIIEVELTYALGRNYWGYGYATEAGRVLIEYGFSELNIGRIVNSVAKENVGSINLMNRLGFHIEKNLNINAFSGTPFKSPLGVIGILEKRN